MRVPAYHYAAAAFAGLFFFQADDGIRDDLVTGVQTCALPISLGIVIGAGLTTRLIGRVGPRVPMTTGALLAAIGLFWLSAVTPQANYAADVLGPLVVLAIGLGMAFVSTNVVVLTGVKSNESGLASALLNVGRQLGGSLGIAIMGTIAATVTRDQLATGPLTHAA